MTSNTIQKSPFIQPITNFNSLGEDLIYSLAKAEWWLLKYSDLYAEHKHELPYNEDFEFPHDKGISEFMDIYHALLLISEVSELESTFSERLASYEAIRVDKEKRIQWIETNRELFEKYQYELFRESNGSLSVNYGTGKHFYLMKEEFWQAFQFLEIMEGITFEYNENNL